MENLIGKRFVFQKLKDGKCSLQLQVCRFGFHDTNIYIPEDTELDIHLESEGFRINPSGHKEYIGSIEEVLTKNHKLNKFFEQRNQKIQDSFDATQDFLGGFHSNVDVPSDRVKLYEDALKKALTSSAKSFSMSAKSSNESDDKVVDLDVSKVLIDDASEFIAKTEDRRKTSVFAEDESVKSSVVDSLMSAVQLAEDKEKELIDVNKRFCAFQSTMSDARYESFPDHTCGMDESYALAKKEIETEEFYVDNLSVALAESLYYLNHHKKSSEFIANHILDNGERLIFSQSSGALYCTDEGYPRLIAHKMRDLEYQEFDTEANYVEDDLYIQNLVYALSEATRWMAAYDQECDTKEAQIQELTQDVEISKELCRRYQDEIKRLETLQKHHEEDIQLERDIAEKQVKYWSSRICKILGYEDEHQMMMACSTDREDRIKNVQQKLQTIKSLIKEKEALINRVEESEEALSFSRGANHNLVLENNRLQESEERYSKKIRDLELKHSAEMNKAFTEKEDLKREIVQSTRDRIKELSEVEDVIERMKKTRILWALGAAKLAFAAGAIVKYFLPY